MTKPHVAGRFGLFSICTALASMPTGIAFAQSDAAEAASPYVWAAAPPVLGDDGDAADAPPTGFDIEPPDIIRLGWGWSQSRAEAIPTVCVVFKPAARDAAQDASISISEVRDSYALSKAMKVSGSVSVKTVAASGSGKAAFAKNSSVSSNAVTFLVSAEVMNAATFAAPVDEPTKTRMGAVRLTDDAAKLARRNMDDFQRVCGEGYVSAVKNGARAYMLASTVVSSRKDRETVRASAQGSGWGVRVSAAASGSKSTSSSKFERHLDFYQQGGAAGDGTVIKTKVKVYDKDTGEMTEVDVDLPASDLPSDANEGIARIKKLAESAAKAGKIFEAHVTPYQSLANFPSDEDILADEDEHDEIAATWGAYNSLFMDLKAAIETPERYSIPLVTCGTSGAEACAVVMTKMKEQAALAQAERLQDMALDALARIERAAEQCLVDEEKCDFEIRSVRSPYAVRASMPLLLPEPKTSSQADTALIQVSAEADAAADTGPTPEEHTAIQLREVAQGRCAFGATTPGCIRNAEIREWAARKGLVSVTALNLAELREQVLACNLPEEFVLTGDGGAPDAPVLWVPASLAFEAGAPVCQES
jgi:hypothetical protein